jgi:hypothetical protein
MSLLYFIFVLLEKLEGGMNHCDGWPSKGNSLKEMKVVGTREREGELGDNNDRNGSSKKATCLKFDGQRNQEAYLH